MPSRATSSRYVPDEEERPGMLGAALALAARRPLDTLAATLAACCTVMIFINALALQQGRPTADKARASAVHTQAPAATPVPQRAEAPKRSDLVEQVQTALAERGHYEGVVDGLPGSATTAAIRAFEQAQGMSLTGEASERVLAALLTAPIKRAEARPAARPAKPQAAAAAPVAAPAATGSTGAPNGTLMAAQRALAKIGYGPVTIDGRLGAETRNAIKNFERDRGMAETGELSPSVLRALQAMTGAPLQ